jgi:hypothetical protein
MLNYHNANDGVNGFPGNSADNQAAPGTSGTTDNASSGSRQSPKIGLAFSEGAVTAAIECGYSPIPGRWKPGKFKDEQGNWQQRELSDAKRPLQNGWQEFCDRQMTVEEQQAARKGRRPHLPQIHLAMGFNNVISIDRDTECPFVNKIIDDVIGRSPVARFGSKGRADIYRVEGDLPPSEKWYGREADGSKTGGPIVEILAHGCNLRIPPSMHPTAPSGFYRWESEDHKVYNTTFEELPAITAEKVALLKERLAGYLYKKPETEGKPRKTVKKETLTEQLHKRYQALADKLFKDRMADVAAQRKPGRDNALLTAVCAIGVFVHHGYIKENDLMAEVVFAAKANGFDKEPGGVEQAKKTAQFGLDKSANDELPELDDRPFEGGAAFGFKTEKQARSDKQSGNTDKPSSDDPTPPNGGDGDGEQPRGMVWPHLTENGGIQKRSQRNIAAFLKFAGVSCAYNDFAQRPVVFRHGKEEVVDDMIMRELWLHADQLGMQSNEGYFQSVILNFCAKTRFNPVTTWLDGLIWDGVPRIDTWTQVHLGCADTPLQRSQGSIQLLAAVRRARHPGTKHDILPVLEGPQGGGKSTAISILAGGGSLFTDGLNIGDDPKVIIEQTADAWHVELAELAGMGKREVEGVKSFLSRQHDSARLSYDRANTRRSRNFVMWATTNDDEYLIDPTGNRRFWPWKVGKIDLVGLQRDREQLWAEAAHREKAGESIALPAELYAAAAEEQRSRVQVDPWQQTLEDAIGDRHGKIMVTDIWCRLCVDSKTQNPALGKRISGIMKLMGWKKDKQRGHNGKAVNCYSKPAPGCDTIGKGDPWISL